jgi:hypothetical protein
MYLEIYVDPANRTYNFRGQINQDDFDNLELDNFDKLVIQDCMREDSRSISDKLLALELICRRIEENETSHNRKVKRTAE